MKIKEDQLSKIVEQQKKLSELNNSIGILENQKYELIFNVSKLNKEILNYKEELEAEYGAININLSDGSYTKIDVEGNKKD
jgi:predicted mannosyl-3-phosphoglycerate phosphatase (HAD superfamily)